MYCTQMNTHKHTYLLTCMYVYTIDLTLSCGLTTTVHCMAEHHRVPPLLSAQSAPFEKYIDCMTGSSYISLILLACYKLLLAIIGCVLALQNRKVNIPELREAKLVGVATYAFLFAITVTVATLFAVTNTRARAIVISVEGLCTVTFLLAILFIPKVGTGNISHSACCNISTITVIMPQNWDRGIDLFCTLCS